MSQKSRVVSARRQPAKKSDAPSRSVVLGLPSDKDLATTVGSRLKQLRMQAGLTLENLAVRSGVSRAMLSNVERAEKSPTLAVFVRIAKGLDVQLSTLMGAEPSRAKIVTIRAAQRLTFKDPESGFERHILSPTHANGGVELLLHRIPAGKSSGTLPRYKSSTEKYLVVQAGKLQVRIGNKVHSLNAGDAFYFDVNEPYRFDNPGRSMCTYYLAIARKR